MTPETSRKAAARLPSQLRRLLAAVWTGRSDSKALVDWATDQLVAGKDSPALRILAGLAADDSREIREYFKKTLADLRVPCPSEHDCLVYYCGDIARDILANKVRPLSAFNSLWQVTSELDYPSVLRCWTQLEVDLDVMEYYERSVPEREAAVRQACEHFMQVLDSFTETGVPRLTQEKSLETLRSRGFDTASSPSFISHRTPVPENNDDTDQLALEFFRTKLAKEDFRDLTIPWSLFLRSEIVSCRFENTDLAESSMRSCDWNDCVFTDANLCGCDLRRSVFRNCAFYNAILDRADLRGARFVGCWFGGASMKETQIDKTFGLFAGFRAHRLRFSKEQSRQVNWVSSVGEEPPGG